MLLCAAFVIAVHRRFSSASDLREVGRFIAQLHRELVADLAPRETEAMVRAALGETHLLESVEPEDAVRAAWAVLLGIVKDLGSSRAEIEALIQGAESQNETIAGMRALDAIAWTSPEMHQACWTLPHQWWPRAAG